jgi:hypothetical protein
MLTIILFWKTVNDTPEIRKKTSLMADITIGYYGSLFGYLGYRDLGSFAKFNQKVIVKIFHITLIQYHLILLLDEQ